MNKKLFCILITLLFFFCNINIIFSEPKKDEWIKISTGITGGIIKGFVQSKQDKNLLYCATFGKGVYKSENYGRLWKSFSKGLDSLHLLSIAIHPKNDQVLLVGTSGFGIYKTIDGGIHWEQSRIGLDHGVINYLLFDPDVHHYVYAFTKDGMYKSYDEGATWIYVPTDFMRNLVNFFHVSPLNPKKFFVCARDMGFYYSENKGENWKKVSDNDHMKEVTSVAEDPDNKLILYIGTLRDGILKYRYDEFKKAWNEEHFGLSIFHVTSILINPLNHDEILASTFGDGLFHSLDKGKNWNKIEEGPGSTDIQFLYQDGFNTPIIWAATHSMGIWQSNNRGINWVERNTNLDGLVMNGIISDVNDPSILYAYTFGNVFKSLSKGVEWTRVTDGLPNSDIKCLVIDPDDSNTIYVGTDGSGAYRSLNGAKTWSSINSGLNHKRIFALAVNPKNSKHIIAGSYGKGIFQTDDGGRTWKSTNDGIKDAFVVSVIFHPSEIDTIFAGSSNTGIFKSTDNGNHWTPINSGLETKNIISLIMNPGYPNILYCGTEAYKAFKSVNGGLNWELMDQGLNQTYSRHFAVHPEYPNIVYCSGNQGIFYSANRGIYWNSLNNGLEKNSGLNIYDANMISTPIDDPTTIFVATYMGVYQYEMTDLPDIDIDAPIIELENKQNPITVKEPFIEIKGKVSDTYTGISTFEVNKRQIMLSPDGVL